MQLVDNDVFLSQLAALFESSKEKGTIWLTHKRLTYDGEDATKLESGGDSDSREYPVLLRATNGDKIKFSTKIQSSQLLKFHTAYGSLLKANMANLRKRDKKREKTRQEQAVRRKKRVTEPIVVEGPKRGNARRKRQRKIKATLRQQQSQQQFKEREEARRKVDVVI
ncbi:signal recognition particle, SRP9/SRP14 subunit [Pluteus cervinus]|uniref:Signal recognition particle, SRP9/SRP14 subunit n=1 Tax=Pluteus cervinus TaxID=181527 RepID=A0ACD3AW20_9AGAR|nr:signal recognition particle, SRP9/SRP14 subunit [Pluteus cervinus]